MNNLMNGMFGKVAPGMCRLSMSGDGFDIETGEIAPPAWIENDTIIAWAYPLPEPYQPPKMMCEED